MLTCKIKFRNKLSKMFKVITDLRRGDVFSPLLLNLALEKMTSKMPSGTRNIGDWLYSCWGNSKNKRSDQSNQDFQEFQKRRLTNVIKD